MAGEVFVQPAKQLRTVVDLVEGEASTAYATALLAVHAAIALNDALLSAWIEKPRKGLDHLQPVEETSKQCQRRPLNPSGVNQLRSLIHQKSAISHGDQRVSHEKALALAEASRRFEAWTFSNCKELAQWDRQ